MIAKGGSNLCIVTLPPSKTCTTRTKSDTLWVPLIEDNPLAGVLQEWTVSDDMSWVITEGTEIVWTVPCKVAKMVEKRTIVLNATVLGVTRGILSTVRTLIL